MLYLPIVLTSCVSTVTNQLGVTLVFGINDQRDICALQNHIWNQCTLGAQSLWLPMQPHQSFVPAACSEFGLKAFGRSFCYGLNPCFKKNCHIHAPRQTCQIAGATEPPFIDCPVDCFETFAKDIGGCIAVGRLPAGMRLGRRVRPQLQKRSASHRCKRCKTAICLPRCVRNASWCRNTVQCIAPCNLVSANKSGNRQGIDKLCPWAQWLAAYRLQFTCPLGAFRIASLISKRREDCLSKASIRIKTVALNTQEGICRSEFGTRRGNGRISGVIRNPVPTSMSPALVQEKRGSTTSPNSGLADDGDRSGSAPIRVSVSSHSPMSPRTPPNCPRTPKSLSIPRFISKKFSLRRCAKSPALRLSTPCSTSQSDADTKTRALS